MNKEAIEYALKIIGAFKNPNYENIANATKEFCEIHNLDSDVDPQDIKQIHNASKQFGSIDDTISFLMNTKEDDIDVPNAVSLINSKMSHKEDLNKLRNIITETANPMERITDYRIEKGKTIAELSENVKKKMAYGWKPYGGIAAAAFGISPVGGNSYVQAMVKFK